MKTFHLGDLLSITTQRLVANGHIGAIHELLDYMTGERLFTHQLPRAARECEPALLRQFPRLAEVHAPDEFEGKEHVERWLAEQVTLFGEWFEVEPLAEQDHTRIDPVAELAMIRPDLPVIVVEP